MSRFSKIALCLCLAAPGLASAEAVNVMPTPEYDEMAAKLIMSGYRDVRIIDADLGAMSAYDREGSEVRIKVDVARRTVVSVDPVHDADR